MNTQVKGLVLKIRTETTIRCKRQKAEHMSTDLATDRCYGLNVLSSQNAQVELLTLNMMVLGDGVDYIPKVPPWLIRSVPS